MCDSVFFFISFYCGWFIFFSLHFICLFVCLIRKRSNEPVSKSCFFMCARTHKSRIIQCIQWIECAKSAKRERVRCINFYIDFWTLLALAFLTLTRWSTADMIRLKLFDWKIKHVHLEAEKISTYTQIPQHNTRSPIYIAIQTKFISNYGVIWLRLQPFFFKSHFHTREHF